MCLFPKKVYNRTLSFIPSCDSVFTLVPCGHCEECRRRKQNDYYIRSYFEFKACKELGYTLFFTLTYNNYYLPHLVSRSDGLTIPCFCKTDVQNFMAALRKRYLRKYPQSQITYLITSEYGSHTRRPHYHGLIHINNDKHDFYLRSIIRDLWHYGFVCFSSNRGVVEDYRALRYVSKYVTKDLGFANDFDKTIEVSFAPDKDSFNYLKSKYKPFTLISEGYGLGILQYETLDNLLKGTIKVPYKNTFTLLHTPLYIDRKLFYYVDDNKCYKLNSLGVDMKLLRNDNSKQRFYKTVTGLFDSLEQSITKDDVFLFNSITNKSYSYNDFIVYCKTKYKNTDINSYIDYLRNYRDFSYIDETSFLPDSINYKPLSYKYRITKHFRDRPFDINYKDFASNELTKNYILSHLYNDFYPDLEDFSILVDFLISCLDSKKQRYYNSLNERHERSKLIKQIYG